MKKITILLFSIFAIFSVSSQTYNIATLNGTTQVTCSGTFVDDGGTAGNYTGSRNDIITFCPATAGDVVKVTFSQFCVKETTGQSRTCEDWLWVYQGNAAYAATNSGNPDDIYCGTLTGAQLPVVISTSPDGCITFQFQSTANKHDCGWTASLSCVTPCLNPLAGINTGDEIICSSDAINPGNPTVNFDASSSTVGAYIPPTVHSIVQYNWDFGDGATATTGTATTTHTYNTPGVYKATVSVQDNNTDFVASGCKSTNAATKDIYVVPPPTISDAGASVSCGDCIDVSAIATSQTAAETVPAIAVVATTLPDGNGTCYTNSVDYGGYFPTGATMSAGCYPQLCIDLSHSWARDLTIDLIAPNGQTIRVYNREYPATAIKFGECTNATDGNPNGCPATYCISTNGSGMSWATTAGVINAPPDGTNGGCAYTGTCETGNYFKGGTYNPSQPWSNLNGAPLNGVWTLRVCDNQSLDDGTLHNWTLTFPSSCFKNLNEITPDMSTITWTASGSNPAGQSSMTNNCNSVAVFAPGPDTCPPGQTCEGNELTCDNTVCFNGSASGNYVYNYLVEDEYGCQYDGDVTISVACACSATASISLTGTSPICNDGSCSEISITVGGGTGPYNVTYTDGTSNFVIGGGSVAAGTYPISVCPTSNTTYTLVSVEDLGVPCFGLTSGSATVNVTQPTTPTFTQLGPYCQNSTPGTLPTSSTNGINGTWNGPISTSTVGTATYTFTPTAGQCANTTTMDVEIIAPVTPQFDQLGPYCVGDTPDVLPTTSNNGATGTWNATISTASAGTVQYTFTASSGCFTTATMDIEVIAPTVPTFTQLGPYCQGTTPGTFNTTSNNGYDGTWSPSTISTASVGIVTYTFTPTAGQCAAQTTMDVQITAPNITPTFTQLGSYCQGTTPGTFTNTSNNGITGTWSPSTISTASVGTVTYTFTPAAGQCAVSTTMDVTTTAPNITPTFTQLGPYCLNDSPGTLPTTSNNGITGTWSPSTVSTATANTTTYTFTPAAGQCAVSTTMNIQTKALPTANNLTPSLCEDSGTPGSTSGVNLTNNNGSVNGNGSATFNWFLSDGTTPVATPTNTTVSNGDVFIVEVTLNGCTNTATVTYTVTSTISLNAITPTLCEDSPGSGQVANVDLTGYNNSVFAGGTSYTWTGGNTQTITDGMTINVQVTSGNCSNDVDVVFTVTSQVLPAFTQLGPYCENEVISDVLATSSEDATPITGTWSPSVISNTANGTYTFTPDGGQCAQSTTMDIIVNPLPTIGGDIQVCVGQDANVTPSTGGTWVSSDNTIATVTNAGVVSGLVDGTVTLTFTDATTNCSSDVTFTVNPLPDASFTLPASVCLGFGNVTLTPNQSGGSFSGTGVSGNIFDPVAAGVGGPYDITYDITVNGCTSSITLQISVTDLDDASFSFANYCEGGANGPSNIITSGGTFAFNPIPSDGAVIDANTGVITGGVAGTTYTIEYTTAAGPCQNSSTTTVSVISLPTASISGSTTICNGDAIPDLTIDFTGSPDWIFTVNGVSYTTSDNPYVFTDAVAGVNTITAVTDATGCPGVISNSNATITVNTVSANFTANPETGIVPLEVFFTNTSQPSGLTYSWDFGDGNTSSSQNPTNIYNADGTFTVMLAVQDGIGCVDTAYLDIIVLGATSVDIPNVFSPDNEGSNQLFKSINPVNVKNESFQIFNRWGQLLYEGPAWDGKYNGKDVPEGTYYYIYYGEDLSGTPLQLENQTGSLTLVRSK